MPSRIPTHRPRVLGSRKAARAAFDRKRAEEKASRAWYNTPRWRALRGIILGLNPWCVRCLRKDPPRTVPATTVNHTKPHKGDERLFWDSNNLEGVCAPCHNSDIQKEEKAAERARKR